MASLLSTIFADKLINDDRAPVGKLKIPAVEGSFLVFLPKPAVWNQLFALLVVQVAILSVFATAIYLLIVKKRSGKTVRTGQLLGFGVIIPLALVSPFLLTDALDIQSPVIRLGVVILPQIVVFRCIEAMYDTSPPIVESSLVNYISYYSSSCDNVWGTKTKLRIAVSSSEIRTNIWRIVSQMLVLSLIISYMMHHKFQPHDTNVVLDQYNVNLDLFQYPQLLNNYFAAIMTFFALSLGFNMCAFANNLQGVSHRQVFRNPLFSSVSPSDFWGYRWNMVIHSTLKRGVFKPMRKAGFSSTLAIISAFLASGLLHDYSWMVMFRPTVAQRDENGKCVDCWAPIMGKQSFFFLWCGITMILERPIGKLTIAKWATKNLPRPIISTMVVLTVLPFAHWFAGDWIVGKYFEQLSQGLFKVTYEAP